MSNTRVPSRLAACLLALLLIALCAPTALASGEYQASVTAKSMNVYADEAPYPLLGALDRGTEVTVKAVNGDIARISYGGRTGLARLSDMARKDQSAATAMVVNRDSRLYAKPSTASRYASVSAGTEVELLAVNGKCAQVRYGGQTGYMLLDHLSTPGATVTQTPQAPAEPVKTGRAAVVTTQSVRVYANADYTGRSITLDRGVKLTLLATRGDVAMAEKNGAIGFMPLASLSRDSGETQAQPTGGNPFSSGSNAHAIYAYLTGEMGYNRAAAMGVMANIRYESDYNPAGTGDGGTSYGICQWHAGRKTNLINWCSENGLDHTTLQAQLRFLRYELTTRYPSVHSYLKQVENTAEGAYDAGYYFCFNFEAPAARTSQSTKRATYARDTLFAMK